MNINYAFILLIIKRVISRERYADPSSKRGQIEFLVSKDALYSEKYAKIIFYFFVIISFNKILSF